MSYETEIATNKKFQGNVVIQIGANYFAIRQPDSGLVIPSPNNRSIQGLILNPTTIDIRRVSTTIASYSFKILDKDNFITQLIAGDASAFLGQSVSIFLGRSGVGMDFADYFPLPKTRVKKVDFSENSYSFASAEETDRIGKPVYDVKAKLAVSILDNTTVFQMQDSLADFPSAGFLKLESEIVSYSGVNLSLNQFTGVLRGLLGSTAVEHEANVQASQAEVVTDNPLSLIIRLLVSGGGGGSYDTLQDGLAISNTLIDVAGIEALRDELFSGVQFKLLLTDIESTLKFIEDQLLMPNNLRFTYSQDSKLTLVILDKARFVDTSDIIDEDSISSYPKWGVDDNRIVNAIEVQWDYNEGANRFQKLSVTKDTASIATYGERTPLKYTFQGIKESLDGQALVDDFIQHLLDRLSSPTPEISVNTHVDKSLLTIGDKTKIESSQIPSADGTLAFANELEIVSRSINFQTGDVNFKLAYTSFTNIRSCYLCPSDLAQTVINQKTITVPAGRGSYYSAGWVMRLYDNVARDYTADAINPIESVVGDTITFVNNFTTTLVAGQHRIKFADYDDVVDSQKRYCFISDSGANFPDGKPTYRITY